MNQERFTEKIKVAYSFLMILLQQDKKRREPEKKCHATLIHFSFEKEKHIPTWSRVKS
jgi:hypothetical protein